MGVQGIGKLHFSANIDFCDRGIRLNMSCLHSVFVLFVCAAPCIARADVNSSALRGAASRDAGRSRFGNPIGNASNASSVSNLQRESHEELEPIPFEEFDAPIAFKSRCGADWGCVVGWEK